MKTFLWIVLPYICLTSFVVGHFWRYKYDKFGWTSRSSELYEKRVLSWASPLFHFGILGVLAGHVVGLLVPESWTSAVGISERTYHVVAVTLGTIAGVATVVGLVLLIYRRRMTPSVLRVTSVADKAMYPLLGAVIALGIVNTIGVNLLGLGGHGGGYNYRSTVAVWFRDVLMFHPSATQMSGAPWSFQLHALLALALLAVWPFTRLVHVLAAPIGYAFRPYIVYRSREPQGASRPPRRGWEETDRRAETGARSPR
ncbi:MAG TPA: respiratory nitrate reductase subunit gamma [Acidimicrobiales bacterium]|nr:respiratory nitrate reductase subunit gamma [Acidimicrobiales bacterium]